MNCMLQGASQNYLGIKTQHCVGTQLFMIDFMVNRLLKPMQLLALTLTILLGSCSTSDPVPRTPNAGMKRIPYASEVTNKEFGFEMLDAERQNGFEVSQSERKLLDAIIRSIMQKVQGLPTTTPNEVIRIFKTMNTVIKSYGITYGVESLLSTGLRNKKLDCDLLSYVYLSVADAIGLPIYGMNAPRHFFVMWDDGTTQVLWETTSGSAQDKDYYINLEFKGRVNSKSLDEGVYLRKLTRKESYSSALTTIARAMASSNRDKSALPIYNTAIEYNPKNVIALTNRGNCLQRLGNNTSALEDHNKALRLDPNYAVALTNRGVVKTSLGDFASAINDHTNAITLDNNNPQMYFNRAVAYNKRGQYVQAIADYTKVIELDGTLTKAYYNRANTFSQLGKQTQALSDYTKVLDREPTNADVLYNRGVVYQTQGKHTQAISDYTLALKYKPNDASIYRNRSASYVTTKQYQQALNDLNECITRSGGTSDDYLSRAQIFRVLKDYKRALEDCNQTIKLENSNADAIYLRALCLYDIRQTTDADICSDLRKAESLGSAKAKERRMKLCK
jgi:tetratricopeptide (TPR) repeat protein